MTVKAETEITLARVDDGAQGPAGADGKMLYAECTTDDTTAAKVATITPATTFLLSTGATVAVHFTYTNTATTPTLNVNSTGAVSIYAGGTAMTAEYNWLAGETCVFVYDGTYWQLTNRNNLSEFVATTTEELQNLVEALDATNDIVEQQTASISNITDELSNKATVDALADVDTIVKQYLGTDGYIKLSGSALVLGQGQFQTRITPQAMVFYDNETPVASISNQELIINRTRVSDEMRMGNFVWTIKADGRLILKYAPEEDES